ncbi:hypothetical protein E6H16_10185 [Candidatus Bathyarchaeota archaeon]|nr:MAG: hypothetical protein E6H16_10185 [Candidatus Bathyarchaeota archaeon]
MSDRPICPSCGSGNPPTLSVCWKCGVTLPSTPTRQHPTPSITSLTTPATLSVSSSTFQSQPTSTPVQYPPIYTDDTSDTLHEMAETRRKLDTSHTRKGLVLLTISYTSIAIIIAASTIDLLWGLLASIADLIGIVGGLLVVVGRDSFGRAHSRNTSLCVVFFMISIVTITAGKILFGATLVLSQIPNGTITYGNTTSSTVNPYIILYITSMIATALTGLAVVFLTYALHRKTGRIILSVSYITLLALTVMMTALILQGFAIRSSIIVDLAYLQEMRYQYEILQLVTIIPTLAFAFSFYLALRRINNGEIPESTAQKTLPAY